MLDLSAILRQIDKVKVLPWKGVLWLLAASFTAASIVSSFLGEVLMPDPVKSFRQKPAITVSAVNKEKPSLGQEDVKAIVKRNIFNIEGKTGEESEKKEELQKPDVPANEIVKTTLPVKLVGTIYSGDPLSGIAMIEDTSKKSLNSFFVGDQLSPEAKVIEIHREKVILDHSGRREFLELEKKELVSRRQQKAKENPAPVVNPAANENSVAPPDHFKEEGFERQGTNIVVSSDYRTKLLSTDFAKVLQDAKAEPNFVNGELNGFRLNRIRNDSIYQKAGLQNGDVVKEINGVSLVDTAQAVKLLNSLRGENEIEIRVDREGKSLNLNMRVQ